jgi:hypothetical protein
MPLAQTWLARATFRATSTTLLANQDSAHVTSRQGREDGMAVGFPQVIQTTRNCFCAPRSSKICLREPALSKGVDYG